MPVISFFADDELMKLIDDKRDELKEKSPLLGRPSRSEAIRVMLLEGTFKDKAK